MVNKQYSATDLEAFMKIAVNWQSTGQGFNEGVDLKSEMQQYLNNPAVNMYKKRERTQNWNHQEKKYLLELCRKDMRIIENKRLDAGLTAVKNKAWKIIHQKFSKQFGTDRTCNRLKEQWRRMKACTRNEIIDYNNRVQRQGEEVADRKRPSPFTFEVWNFMQEAKKVCKSEALDGIDYSKIPLALEEDYEYREEEQNADEDHDLDDSRTPPQELCDIDIKEETNETLNDTYNNNNESMTNGIGERLSSASPHPSRSSGHDMERLSIHSPHSATALMEHTGSAFLTHNGPGELGAFQPAFHMSNLSATLEALNALRNAQLTNNLAAAAVQQAQQKVHHQQAAATSYDDEHTPDAKRPRTSSGNCSTQSDEQQIQQPQLQQQQQQSQHHELNEGNGNVLSMALNGHRLGSNSSNSSSNNETSTELRCFMEMQSKEHMMRMSILEVQLQAAKFNRDLLEINKTIAAQKLRQLGIKH